MNTQELLTHEIHRGKHFGGPTTCPGQLERDGMDGTTAWCPRCEERFPGAYQGRFYRAVTPAHDALSITERAALNALALHLRHRSLVTA